ncbi:hypothetical protein E4Q23_09845 [Candidatus Accumulibacter phosphatis]|uniref:Mobile element protein n=1 Tax=Candidatus Accumulibacter phosphatis TaxID=327160 RepID=A0ABX1TUS8_9PROT|nr:hypothetical protein [Candidatus Accumulibacter phosphatis]NMQ28034.1 hypothetical protein [Candidatus Accumulibacter phosphatis]
MRANRRVNRIHEHNSELDWKVQTMNQDLPKTVALLVIKAARVVTKMRAPLAVRFGKRYPDC